MEEEPALENIAVWCTQLDCREFSRAPGLASFRLPETQALVSVRAFAEDGWQLETQLPVPMRTGAEDEGLDVQEAIRGAILARSGNISAALDASLGLTIAARLFLDGLSKHVFASLVYELDKSVAQVQALIKDLHRQSESSARLEREPQPQADEIDPALQAVGEVELEPAESPAQETRIAGAPVAQITCPNCGRSVAGDKKFCIHCGQKLR